MSLFFHITGKKIDSLFKKVPPGLSCSDGHQK